MNCPTCKHNTGLHYDEGCQERACKCRNDETEAVYEAAAVMRKELCEALYTAEIAMQNAIPQLPNSGYGWNQRRMDAALFVVRKAIKTAEGA